MDCSMPGYPGLDHLRELAQTHVNWVCDAIQPSHPLLPPFPHKLRSSVTSRSFPVTWLFSSGSQSIGASPSASVIPMNIQDWFPLGLTGLTSFQFRQEYSSGLPCPPPGDLPNPEIEPISLVSAALAGRLFTTSATWEAQWWQWWWLKLCVCSRY